MYVTATTRGTEEIKSQILCVFGVFVSLNARKRNHDTGDIASVEITINPIQRGKDRRKSSLQSLI